MTLENEYKKILQDREELRHEILLNGDDKIHIPVNLARILWNAKEKFGIKKHHVSDLHPKEVIDKIDQLCAGLCNVRGTDPISLEANFNSTKLFKINVRFNLCSKKVILKERLS